MSAIKDKIQARSGAKKDIQTDRQMIEEYNLKSIKMTSSALVVSEDLAIKAEPDEALKKLQEFDDMRKKGVLCDMVFLAKGKKVQCHKFMILKASLFCANKILSDKPETKGQPIEINIDSIAHEVVDRIVSYMYTGNLLIKLSEVQAMYAASQLLQLTIIQENCINLLCTNTIAKPAKMLRLKPTTIDHVYCQLWLAVEKRLFVKENFSLLIESEEFPDIANNHFKNFMLAFLNREERADAGFLCNVLSKWAKNDYTKRRPSVEWLIKKYEDDSKIELSLMTDIDRLCGIEPKQPEPESLDLESSVEEVEEIVPDKSSMPPPTTPTKTGKVQKNGKVKEGMEPETKKLRVDNNNSVVERPRTKEVVNDVVVDLANMDLKQASMLFVEVQMVDGENASCSQRDLWTFDFEDKRFSKLIAMPSSAVTMEEIVVAGNKVFFIGGVSHHTVSNQVFELNLRDTPRQWRSAPSLIVGRKEFATCLYKDYIFVIGGSSTKSAKGALTSVERLNVKKEGSQWESVASMEDPRVACSAAVLNGFIFVVGGRRVKETKITWKSVEMLDVSCNVWTKVSNMWHPRSGACLVSLSDKFLYVCGGENNDGSCNSVEVYDLTKDVWTFASSLKQKRKYSSAVSVGGKIYVFGGYDKKLRINSAEVFDPKGGSWQVFITPGDTVTTSFRTASLVSKASLQ